jgi:hypothetical protein
LFGLALLSALSFPAICAGSFPGVLAEYQGAVVTEGPQSQPAAGSTDVHQHYVQKTILRASDAQVSDQAGTAVAVSADIAIVGAKGEDGGPGDPLANAGAAYVFSRDARSTDTWSEVKRWSASDAQAGDEFGFSVAISGDTAVIGARKEDGPLDLFTDAGAAYVFQRDHGGVDNWGEVAKLTASDAQVHDFFGGNVAIAGDYIVVGAYGEDGPGDTLSMAGAAYVFHRDQGGADNWGEVAKLTASDAQATDVFSVVAISGSTVVVGALFEDGGPSDPLTDSGAAYIFERDQGGANNWGEVKKLSASDSQVDDQFGSSVAISGNTIVVAANAEDGGSGDPISDAGAAYIFLRNPA